MLDLFRKAVITWVGLMLLTGLAYPLAMTGLAQWWFPSQANGSLISRDGQVVASRLIARPFTDAGHFWSRPSATTYDGLNSGGSNLGPLNPTLDQQITQRIVQLGSSLSSEPIPVDLVTSSASGLDPELSPAAAYYQAPRIAAVRHLPVGRINDLIAAHTVTPPLRLGPAVVNVLLLNLDLDSVR